jgi:hypothetical protein
MVGYIMLLKKDMTSQIYNGQDFATGMIIHFNSLYINENKKIYFYCARQILKIKPFIYISKGFIRANLKAPFKKIAAMISINN